MTGDLAWGDDVPGDVPNYVPNDVPKKGSWFIQATAEVLRKEWPTSDLLSMMTRVNDKVDADFKSNADEEYMKCEKQIPCVTSRLTKDLFFSPRSTQ